MKKIRYYFLLVLFLLITACSEKSTNTTIVEPEVPDIIENPLMVKWGLGKELKEEFSLNRDYEWYIDQKETGIYNYNNCGPSCVTMAIKWANRDFDLPADSARSFALNDGGWWYASDITGYLDMNDVTNNIIEYKSVHSFIDNLKDSLIIILAIDAHYISFNYNQTHRTGRYYAAGEDFGHFIILKGYKIVDDKLYFEVYDPNSWGRKYEDGQYKGLDRYYSAGDLDLAIRKWWHYAIIITASDALPKIVESKARKDFSIIPDIYGR